MPTRIRAVPFSPSPRHHLAMALPSFAAMPPSSCRRIRTRMSITSPSCRHRMTLMARRLSPPWLSLLASNRLGPACIPSPGVRSSLTVEFAELRHSSKPRVLIRWRDPPGTRSTATTTRFLQSTYGGCMPLVSLARRSEAARSHGRGGRCGAARDVGPGVRQPRAEWLRDMC